ncbi:MAG: AAA family ATPase [Planctomycetia bacterium]|nr:AAA family ATPase [Planctomycetia bacterium]
MTAEPFLKYVSLVRERVERFDVYPFSIPAIGTLDSLPLHPAVTFFAGENGTGKSTLLEAMAVVEGFNLEGGSRNHDFSTRSGTSELSGALRLGRGIKRLGKTDGFFLRAETMFNLATEVDRLSLFYGDKSLHDQSHGESFLSLLTNRFQPNGLYFLDEPEAAFSPQKQLSLIVLLHELVQNGCQFVIATHSPIIMAYPDAMIYWFSDQGIRPIEYRETEHYKVTRNFLERTDHMLAALLS